MESSEQTTRAPEGHVRRLPDIVLALGGAGLVVGVVSMFAVVDDRSNAPWLASSAVTLASAAVVRLRRPDHPLGVWFFAFAAALPWQYVAMDALNWSSTRDSASWMPAALTIALRVMTATTIVTAMRLFVRFPDGRQHGVVDRRGLQVVDLVQGASCAVLLATPIVAWPEFIGGLPASNPLRIPGFSVSVGTARTIVNVANASVVVGLVLLARRYWRSGRHDRKQIRWLLLPLFAAIFILFGELLLGTGRNGALASVVASAVLSVGIAFGIVRPNGIDVDDVLRRSIVWGLLWLAIASAYVGASAAFGVTIGQRWSVGWAVTITVLAMLALQPGRGALERIASRRLFGAPPDPTRAVARLGDSLAGTYDLETLLPDVETALEEGLGVEWARVRLTPGSEPDDRVPALVVPITLDGDELGVVECGPRLTGTLGEDDEAIVATFARQAALAVRNVRLTTQLRDRTEELAASRARLVRAEEAERRRIEHNIHDGVQQDLVALIGQTGLIRRRLQRDGSSTDDRLAEDLDHLQSGLQRVLLELRELAAGIHPSVLRDRGLLAAIEALAARHPVPVRIRAAAELRGLRLPVEIEGAGYYTVAESLANSLKHADARQLGVTLSTSNGSMSIRIEDDGVGFDPTHACGNGLSNLTERVAALDGVLTVDSRPKHGTTISATLPISESTT